MLRLAHSILSRPAASLASWPRLYGVRVGQETAVDMLAAAEMAYRAIAQAEVVIADEVAAWHAGELRAGRGQRPPTMRAAFRTLFVEYEVRPGDELVGWESPLGRVSHCGVLIGARPVAEGLRRLRRNARLLTAERMRQIESFGDDACEMLFASSFYKVGGECFMATASCAVALSKSGEVVHFADMTLPIPGRPAAPNWWEVPSFTLGLLSCKNVGTQDVTKPIGPPEKWLRRMSVPALTYRLLTIRPVGSGRRREADSPDADGTPQPLSLWRGHFKVFRPERPLFGRYAGSFWWGPHVRGEAAAGVNLKDYRVVTPSLAGRGDV